MAALGCRNVIRLGRASAQLHRDITIAIRCLLRHNLATFQRQYRYGHVPTVILEQPGHSHLLGDNPCAHDQLLPSRSAEHTSELQSLMRISYAVFCLTKKKPLNSHPTRTHHTTHHEQ